MNKIYNKVGFSLTDTDTQLDVYKRAQILSWACNYGHSNCISESKLRFLPLMETNAP